MTVTGDVTKACHSCLRERPLSDFAKNKKAKDGLQYHCRSCQSERFRAWRERNVDLSRAKWRDQQMRSVWGIGVAEYNALHEAQGGVCAICLEPETSKHRGRVRRLAIDHDHETGRIRGLLCTQCNTALGKFRDSESRLLRAVAYLRQH